MPKRRDAPKSYRRSHHPKKFRGRSIRHGKKEVRDAGEDKLEDLLRDLRYPNTPPDTI